MYQDLLETERKLDWTMMRKKVEVQDALARNPTVCDSFLRCTYTQLSLLFVLDDSDVETLPQSYGFWATVADRRWGSGRDPIGKF
jgi:hypothetical protein